MSLSDPSPTLDARDTDGAEPPASRDPVLATARDDARRADDTIHAAEVADVAGAFVRVEPTPASTSSTPTPHTIVVMSTLLTLTVVLPGNHAEAKAAAEGDGLPFRPVIVAPAPGCPHGSSVTYDNKGWEVDWLEDADPPLKPVVVDHDSATTYHPFTHADGFAGLRCERRTHPDQPPTSMFLVLNPSGGSDDGRATVFLYQGDTGHPDTDAAITHLEVWPGDR